jgi:predicted RNA-binding Zn ribbon-like protein
MDTEAPVQPAARDKAPGDLLLIEQLVNSREIDEDADEIADVAGLRAWMAVRGLVDDAEMARLGAADVVRVAAVREALRAMLRTNHGEPPDAEATALLDEEARHASLCVRITAGGGARVTPVGEAVDRLVGRIVVAMATHDVDGSWRRLKVCADDTCLWAFYDNSKNASGTWCSMRVCGNRAKARRHRERTRQARSRQE